MVASPYITALISFIQRKLPILKNTLAGQHIPIIYNPIFADVLSIE